MAGSAAPAAGHIGKGGAVDHVDNGLADGRHCLTQQAACLIRAGAGGVIDLAQAADRRQPAIEHADHLAQGNAVSLAAEGVTAAGSGLAVDDAGVAQGDEDLLEELDGKSVAVGQGAVTAYVNAFPIPTAQIAIFLFEDNFPLNNSPDLPAEENPPPGTIGADGKPPVDWTQFSIVLEEPAGLYGQNGGPVIKDAFGNPL